MTLDKTRIYFGSALRLIGISIRGFFTHTHFTNDGPLETLAERLDTVDQNIDYDGQRVETIRMARREGLRENSYQTYLDTLHQRLNYPGNKVWLDILAPNRRNQ